MTLLNESSFDRSYHMKKIDARGLACPAPVLQTKAALEESDLAVVSILVDNEAARQNVSRFLESRKYTTAVQQNGGDFVITATRDEGSLPEETVSKITGTPQNAKIMIMIAADHMGKGDDELGAKLTVNFIKTLKEMGPDLWRLVFVNSGVKLCIGGSPVLKDLQGLESAGVTILVCGTCLDHFGLLERKEVGETTNMLDIITSMQLADKVVHI